LFKKIICAMDFSPLSVRAAETAANLSRSVSARLTLVHVITPSAEYGALATAGEELRPAIENKLREVAASLGEGVDWGVVDGEPARELALFASRWGGDLIVIGSHARSSLGRALLGSVTTGLVRDATVPVMVVGPESR
jgi:nucleotide-binding universal stress UspA family protein